jgi:murein DD-endopeptidase MepM/ murein hydrolase activator NlpD
MSLAILLVLSTLYQTTPEEPFPTPKPSVNPTKMPTPTQQPATPTPSTLPVITPTPVPKKDLKTGLPEGVSTVRNFSESGGGQVETLSIENNGNESVDVNAIAVVPEDMRDYAKQNGRDSQVIDKGVIGFSTNLKPGEKKDFKVSFSSKGKRSVLLLTPWKMKKDFDANSLSKLRKLAELQPRPKNLEKRASKILDLATTQDEIADSLDSLEKESELGQKIRADLESKGGIASKEEITLGQITLFVSEKKPYSSFTISSVNGEAPIYRITRGLEGAQLLGNSEDEDYAITLSFQKNEFGALPFDELQGTLEYAFPAIPFKRILLIKVVAEHSAESALSSSNIVMDTQPKFYWPLAIKGTITAYFMDPQYASKFGVNHFGVDIAAPRGTVVRSFADGVVKSTNFANDYGYFAVISHGTDVLGREVISIYGHLLDYPPVGVGERVSGGQKIGLVDSTGKSTGNHLHFEIRVANKPVDPLRFLQLQPYSYSPSSANCFEGEFKQAVQKYSAAGYLPSGKADWVRVFQSIAKIESNCNPNARGKSAKCGGGYGECGLMQICNPYPYTYYKNPNTSDPMSCWITTNNIENAVRLLAGKFACPVYRTSGDVRQVIAAYNGGCNSPIASAQDYMRKVLSICGQGCVYG